MNEIKTVIDIPVEYKGYKIHTIKLKDIGKLSVIFEKLIPIFQAKQFANKETTTKTLRDNLSKLVTTAPEAIASLFEITTDISNKDIPNLNITDTLAILNIILNKNKEAIPYFFEMMTTVSTVEFEKKRKGESEMV